ncbi:uncharacterized protein LKV04_004980 [Tautogolabrus adspersus]
MAPAPALNWSSQNNGNTTNSSLPAYLVNIPSTILSTKLSRHNLATGTKGMPALLHPQPRVLSQASHLSLHQQNQTHPGPETLPPQLLVTARSRVVDIIHNMWGTLNKTGALQEENNDLHQNLLQTVVCIESLEVELQRTRDELSHVKEKYKSLLETHTGTKQANSLLGEHLHIASESLSSERKYLLNRVSQLSSELEDAHRTMAALENINVPCLIKELLEKHFNSAETIQKLLTTSGTNNHSTDPPRADNKSNTPKEDAAAQDWLAKSEAGMQRVTAFIPFKQGGNESSLSDQHESRYSPPFSVNDISTAIYKKMAASYAARPQPLYPQSQQQPQLSTNHADAPPKLQQDLIGGDSWLGNGGVKVTLVEQDIVDVTATSAQQILDDFMQQLQYQKEVGGGKEHQGGQ